MKKSHKGKYKVINYKKYKGDPTNVIYRFSWELKFMIWCDKNREVLEWSSEEMYIPYKDPVQNKVRRYFPDFWVIKRDPATGRRKKYIVEVKPWRQTQPPKKYKRTTKTAIMEVETYATNRAKWDATIEVCIDQGWEFKLITERELKI